MHKILQYEWVLLHFSLLLVAQVKIIRWCWLALNARGSSTARTARSVVSDTRKFDRGLTRILHDDLHWLDVADRVTYKLGVIMHRCRHGKAPQYLVDCCTPVTDVVGRHTLSTVARRSPMLSAGSVSGQPHSNRWWSPDIGYPLLDAEHSLCTASWSGTPCLTTSVHSRTMSPLDRAWKPPDTSTFSTLETFVIIAQYKSIFTIPYLSLIHISEPTRPY